MTAGADASIARADDPLALPDAQWQALRAAYAAPPRAYHHFGHVQAVLAQFRDVAAGPGWHRPAEVWLAVLYHDAVYVPGRKDNEARSADLATGHIGATWPSPTVDAGRVSELILLTARHGGLAPADAGDGRDGEDARLFLDCDMAILGAPRQDFAAYDRAIAEEYSAVPRWLYRIKRRQFFRHVLSSERIFLSDHFHARLDAAARENLRAALDGHL